jgi:hypothetical protein
MILIAVLVLAVVWVVVLSVIVGLCVSAAQGDRALMGAPSVRRAAARQAEPVAQLRFVA